jgi:putative phosphoesterase
MRRLESPAADFNRAMLRVGIISDTHGLLRPEAAAFLRGCDHIVHGGDITDVRVLEELSKIAPVTAVRGNNDRGAWAEKIRETEMVRIGDIHVYAIHDLADLDIDPRAAGVDVVISGHTHKPLTQERDGVLFINPGSAGPRRFKLPISIAELTIVGATVTSRTIELTEGAGS